MDQTIENHGGGPNIEVVSPPKIKKSNGGRPPRALIEANKKRGNGKVGRPKGDTHRIQELKARLLSTTGDRVINKIVQIAMDDQHQGQMAALKMCIDRMLPLSLFEKDAKRGSNAVTINIVGVTETTINATEEENTIDMELETVGED